MKIEIKGKQLDISPALPLKLRDWKELEKRGANTKQFENGMITAMCTVAHYVISKVDKTITQEDIDDLELNDPAIQAIFKAIGGGKEELDRPSVTYSTSSDNSTDGVSETLKS